MKYIPPFEINDNMLNYVYEIEEKIKLINKKDIFLKKPILRKSNKINYISYKIYLNTLRKAFNQIKEMEKNAIFEQEDKGEYLEVKIVLPKKDRCFT